MAQFGQAYPDPSQGVPPQPGFYPGGIPQSTGYPSAPGYPSGPGYPPPGAGYPAGGYPPPYPATAYPASPPMSQYQRESYAEEPLTDNMNFSEKSIRLGFIRKVYGILTCQLALTLAVVAAFTFSPDVKLAVLRNPSLWWIALGVMIATLIVMACCGDVRRKAPMNFIFLGLFTAAESFMLGCASAQFKEEEVVLAVGITAIVVLALTLFAFQTKVDFTMMGGVLLVCTLVLILFGLGLSFLGTSKTAVLIYASFGAILFSVYILYDTQLMMGGNHKYSISPEEYIFAALNLYLDIVNLFLYILTIIGASRD